MLKQISGSFGSVIAGACCLGFAPFLAGLSAIGAGFLISDTVLVPLFVVFLGISIWGLSGSRAKHQRNGPFFLGLGSAVVAFAALWFSVPLAYAALAALIAATVWDIVVLRQSRQTHEAEA